MCHVLDLKTKWRGGGGRREGRGLGRKKSHLAKCTFKGGWDSGL